MSCAYEQIKQLPSKIEELAKEAHEELRALNVVDPNVNKDLKAFGEFLEGLHQKAYRATNNLLIKPRVAAALRGEELDLGETDLGTKIKQLRQQLLEMEKQLPLGDKKPPESGRRKAALVVTPEKSPVPPRRNN